MPPTDNGSSTVRTAAVAAASGAAVMAARHALARVGNRREASRGGALSTGLDAAWDAAREHLLPMIGEGAAAAGRYVAENAPDVVRETILPRFLHGFHEAREQREAAATDDD
jgi:hypothetical protein